MKSGDLLDGKYRVLSKVGQGGMSVVYLAINERANQTWAIKEIRRDFLAGQETAKEGFISEIRILRELRHPGLPRIVDVIDTEDAVLLVMDYVEGVSLERIVEIQGPQPEDRITEWARQICDIFSYLHSRAQPIIYRDLKPSNLILQPDGRVKLIDFGTARWYQKEKMGDTTSLGTVGYAAPEQFVKAAQTDARTDLYALGATLYHLATGQNPVELSGGLDTSSELSDGERSVGLSEGLTQVVERCMRRDPNERYQSAEEVRYDIDHLEHFQRAYQRQRRRKMVWFLMCLACCLLFFGCGLFFESKSVNQAQMEYERKMEEADKSSSPAQKKRLYEECIEMPGHSTEQEPYLKLIEAMKEDDHVFRLEEAQTLERLLFFHQEELKESGEFYTELCFRVGKLFWYYFDCGNGEDSSAARAQYAAPWFEEVLRIAPEAYPGRGMARVYSDIGRFYREITTSITEAQDQGRYRLFVEDLDFLLTSLAEDEDEEELVRLELISLAESAIQQYATKLKHDGVAQEDLLSMLSQIEEVLDHGMTTTTELTAERKQSLLTRLPAVRETVVYAYETQGR
ncbi:MAG: serine/threonine protein kinase [Lachnospiraceae bacterium]|nr:serine/threonine protein kinase [Lachnospiraceae bacterium]